MHPSRKSVTLDIELFQKIVNRSFEAIIVINERCQVVFWNPAAERIFGYTAAEMHGRDMHDYITPARYRGTAKLAHSRYQSTGLGDALGKLVEIEGLHKDGRELWVELGLNDVEVEGTRWAFAIIREIDERKRLQAALRNQAMTDPLTGLGNRRAFEDSLHRASPASTTLLFLDIDHLKPVNDIHGHDAGDALIRSAASLVASFFSDATVSARIGGDEFGIIVSGAEPDSVLERCRQLLAQAPRQAVPGDTPPLSMSIGIAHGATLQPGCIRELLRRADEALLESKRSGRATVTVARDAVAEHRPT